MNTPALPIAALSHRRQSLTKALAGQPALIVAGMPRPRNYAANAFRFRPDSHFIYLFGWGSPGAAALFVDGDVTVFMAEPDFDDALWSGPTKTLQEWAECLGVNVRPLRELEKRIEGINIVATIPAVDAESRATQRKWLGRSVPGHSTNIAEADERLAYAMIDLRLAHDQAAQEELRLAAAVTARAHAAGLAATVPGVRESVVRAAMERALIEQGCGTAYGSIVTVHGEILHNEDHHNVIKDGDLLLADVGAETPSGWAGDVTRTWPVSGRFTSEQADLYDVVLRAQRNVIAAVAPGVRYRDLHLQAMRELADGLVQLGILRGDPRERAFDGTTALLFPHGIGHLLGLDVHDMEDLGDRAGYAPGRTRDTSAGLRYLRLDRDLRPGMLVTIEPGIYFIPAILDSDETRSSFSDRVDWTQLQRFRNTRGIRIEDDVLVTLQGSDVLTAAIPKDRHELETRIGLST